MIDKASLKQTLVISGEILKLYFDKSVDLDTIKQNLTKKLTNLFQEYNNKKNQRNKPRGRRIKSNKKADPRTDGRPGGHTEKISGCRFLPLSPIMSG